MKDHIVGRLTKHEVAASPPIPALSPSSSCSAPEEEDNEVDEGSQQQLVTDPTDPQGEIDWNGQWALGLLQPPTMTDTASG